MLVSAIMPTRGRPEYAALAVEAFQAQTWPEKQLVILDDGDCPSFPKGIESAAGEILYHRLGRRMDVGAKRNICCARADGEAVIHLDDDDYSAPGRFADQVTRLLDSGKAVTGYRSMRFTDGQTWFEYRHSGKDYALGTSLCYRRDWWKAHPFPLEQVGEDLEFVRAAARDRQLVVADAGDLMHATIHAGNTCPRQIVGAFWKRCA